MAKKTKKIVAPKPAQIAVPLIVVMAETNWDEKHVKPGANLETRETSRSAFMRHVAGFDGKPVTEWMAAVTKAPPAFSKGKNAYTAKQWITWFVKAGIVELVDA